MLQDTHALAQLGEIAWLTPKKAADLQATFRLMPHS
jgi:hypothetical protein